MTNKNAKRTRVARTEGIVIVQRKTSKVVNRRLTKKKKKRGWRVIEDKTRIVWTVVRSKGH